MKKNFTSRIFIFTAIIATPLVASAAVGADPSAGISSIGRLIQTFNDTVVKSLSTLFASLAMVAFFYGIVEYIWGIRDAKPEKISNGQRFMTWGLVALFVMFSVWGIIKYGQRIFGIDGGGQITVPSLQVGSGLNTPSDNGIITTIPTGGNPTNNPSVIATPPPGGNNSVNTGVVTKCPDGYVNDASGQCLSQNKL